MYDGQPQPERNDPCWCGSGRKYKKCHEAFDEKIRKIQEEGHIVPGHELIKTPEQIAAILYRYAGSPAASSSALNGFADQSAVSSYAVTAMQWAVGNGIITGVSTNGRTTLSAKNNATRAQVSVMLHRFLTMEQ